MVNFNIDIRLENSICVMKFHGRYQRLNDQEDHHVLVVSRTWKFIKRTWKYLKVGLRTTAAHQSFCYGVEPTTIAYSLAQYRTQKHSKQ